MCESCKTVLLDFDEVGAKPLDDRTLQVKLKSPDAVFFVPDGLLIRCSPVNPKCVETYGYPDWTKPENIVTNGAFKLESHRVRERIRLVKNEQYWNAANVKLNIDRRAAGGIAGHGAEFVHDRPGRLDSQSARHRGAGTAGQKRTDFYPTPEMTIYFYRMNCTKPPLE